jgi:murein DD-endopeptidase MepM/ murein hydrolase activator NlpD/Na+-transporting methylmalonyl-CoA/oxaloacetate decarboxylase gamma subunit
MILVVPQRSRTKAWVFLVLFLLIAVVASVSYLAWRQSIPGVKAVAQAPRFLGHNTSFTVTLEAARGNLRRGEVRVVQGGKPVTVASAETPGTRTLQLPVKVESAAQGLKEGGATLEVWGSDDFWRPWRMKETALLSQPVTIDLTPPRVEILSSTRYVSRGGAVMIAFRAGEAARIDVSVGPRVFPSYPYGSPDKGARVALIALPHDFAAGTPLAVTARDEAGNVATRTVPAELKPRPFPRDTIQITDAFLEAKVPELLPQRPPSQPLIEGFLTINRDQRRQAEEEKLKLGTKTADKPLWEGPFVQPRNTKVFSNFAETRTYVYQGKTVDTQVHVGFDLASTKLSPVPAANAGQVAFAGPLTIYGNTVILDHGLGLQTLYAHLSSIAVKTGDAVTKGQELGRSGTTGLAVGDHLHFEVLVAGISVTPMEWWDGKWIRDRVNKPLKEAGLPEIAGLGEVPDDPAPRTDAPVRPSRRRR